MSLFRRHRIHEKVIAPAAHAAKATAEQTPVSPIYKYRVDEELATRIALKAYGAGGDGKPNIPRMPLSG
ncbi:MAG: hypothetical protein ACTHWW_04315 [Arthrobacter sp.]|uniref:hypothetical protein n=1 Tax=Arthrobacter TaxID=1663 RepID=UPI00265140E5|nr:hypothetical protein [Micrococcaceae bacterium]MDN5813154.1 hypothetical protein [Micrococcaceae bacterium]MDN5822724.1 hypothetical protein [Micrococcaceae bacterium]MDN5878188.1 hypothetical protein [Micrococcaceae bacterium]MDN5886699.1 hypothetical protein [Micrococcaceae bacterium]